MESYNRQGIPLFRIILFLLCAGMFAVLTYLVVGGYVADIDKQIADAVLPLRDKMLTTFFRGVTHMADTYVVLGLSIFVIILPGRTKVGIPVAIGTGLVALANTGLKLWVARPRPALEQMLVDVSDYSFPSGHTSASIVFYLFLMILLRRYFYLNKNKSVSIYISILFPILVMLIIFSRLYLGVHYASDLVGGILLGVGLLALFTIFYDYAYPETFRISYAEPDWQPLSRYKQYGKKWKRPANKKTGSKQVDMSMHKAWRYPKERLETRNKMTKQPILVVMAAGMGSRYGGMKQIDPVGDNGEIIIDFSLYDAIRAGFKEAIFIIKREHEQAFKDLLDANAGKHIKIRYAFQELEDLPEGWKLPEGREKPWGTCHAIMAARHLIDGPFCCINADDFYGASAFKQIYDYLVTAKDDDKERFAMVGYYLENTITENGSVARGVCVTENVSGREYLTKLDERLKIEKRSDSIAYTEDDATWIDIPEGSVVSMNFWGFTLSMMMEMIEGFPAFLDEAIKDNPLKAEYLLPRRVDELISSDKATVEVLKSADKWFGVTYKEDKQTVIDSLKTLKENGIYPKNLWG